MQDKEAVQLLLSHDQGMKALKVRVCVLMATPWYELTHLACMELCHS